MIHPVGGIPWEPQRPESECAFCGTRIVKNRYEGMVITEHWDAVQRQPGVLFSMQCPNRPRPGTAPGAYDPHVPR
ncbi:hypothetical protein [Nonomuraea turcica]|uniref:hypothetical protein n=1 Tax=Nonomuraea sp. G32 TaxID=3067274 RepID=UPI00273B6F8C|nr:hypothetical protein [Nonomuraea sp. G32]MDP4505248.1 hypothetical protein [Nonomuraea sp. G32]